VGSAGKGRVCGYGVSVLDAGTGLVGVWLGVELWKGSGQ